MSWFRLRAAAIAALLLPFAMTDAEERYEVGTSLREQGRLSEAISEYDAAISSSTRATPSL